MKPFAKADFEDPGTQRLIHRISPDLDLSDEAVREAVRDQFALPLETIHQIMRLGSGAFELAKAVAWPTLVVQGDDDPLARPSDTRELASQIPGECLSYREVPAGHDLLADRSDQLDLVIDLVMAHFRGRE